MGPQAGAFFLLCIEWSEPSMSNGGSTGGQAAENVATRWRRPEGEGVSLNPSLSAKRKTSLEGPFFVCGIEAKSFEPSMRNNGGSTERPQAAENVATKVTAAEGRGCQPE